MEKEPEQELEPAKLVDIAKSQVRRMVRAGVAMTLAEWDGLPEVLQDLVLFERAQGEARFIARVALAIQDPLQALQEYSAVDGGAALEDAIEAHDDAVVEQALTQLRAARNAKSQQAKGPERGP